MRLICLKEHSIYDLYNLHSLDMYDILTINITVIIKIIIFYFYSNI